MKCVLLGGPKDGLVVEVNGPRLLVPWPPYCVGATWLEDGALDMNPKSLRVAVYGGHGALRHPDRNPDLRALCFVGYEYR